MNKYDIISPFPKKVKKKSSKLKNILLNTGLVAGLVIGVNKCTDWYLQGTMPDLKNTSEWKPTYFNPEADLGVFLYDSHKKEGGKFMYESFSKNNYNLSVKEYNSEKENDPTLTGKIYLPDTNEDGLVGPGEDW